MIIAVILAAGKSTRMGTPKAFLEWGDSTFLNTIVERLMEAGTERIFVVVRPDDVKLAREQLDSTGAKVLLNLDPNDEGPISSIRVALEASGEDCDALMICPVDHPAVERSTYATLLQQANDNPGRIVIPVCQKRQGHPALFPAGVFEALRNLPRGRGADTVVAANANDILEIPVSDVGVLNDIDTPEDYENARAIESEE